MSSSRDTDPQPFSEPTPTKLGEVVRREAKRGAKKLAPALVTLLMALMLFWTTRINVAAEEAKDAAEDAVAKGEKGERTAKTVKVENQAGYAATAEKVDATGDVTVELADRVKALEEEVERLKAAKAGRRPRRKTAVRVPPAVTAPLPPTPAAAAAQDVTQP